MALGDLLGSLLGGRLVTTTFPTQDTTFPPKDVGVPGTPETIFPASQGTWDPLGGRTDQWAVGGLPIIPSLGGLLWGVGKAALAHSMLPRHQRDLGSLLGLFGGMREGYNWLNYPNLRNQYEQQRLKEILIGQGWDPAYAQAATQGAAVGGAPTGGPAGPTGGSIAPVPLPPADLNQTTTSDADFSKAIKSGLPAPPPPAKGGTLLAQTPGAAVPPAPAASVPQAPSFSYGGMRFGAPPRVALGDVFEHLPASAAGQTVRMTPDVLAAMGKTGDTRFYENYLRQQLGEGPETPLSVLQQKWNLLQSQRGREQLGAAGPYTRTRIQQNADGTFSTVYDTLAPEEVKMKQAEEQRHLDQQHFYQEQYRLQTERATAEQNAREAQAAERNIAVATTEQSRLRDDLANLQKLKLGALDPKEAARLDPQIQALQDRIDRSEQNLYGMQQEYYKKYGSGGAMPIEAPPKPTDKISLSQQQQMGQFEASIRNYPDFAKVPARLPTDDPHMQEAWQGAYRRTQRNLDQAVLEIIRGWSGYSGFWGEPEGLRQTIDSTYGQGFYDYAYDQWRKGYTPHVVPAAPAASVAIPPPGL